MAQLCSVLMRENCILFASVVCGHCSRLVMRLSPTKSKADSRSRTIFDVSWQGSRFNSGCEHLCSISSKGKKRSLDT